MTSMVGSLRHLGLIALLSGVGGGLGGCGGVFHTDKGQCEYGDNIYADGESFADADDCNTCSCNNGEVSCTLIGCGRTCLHEGSYYPEGDTFPAGDGCNTCSCGEDGTVACTEIGCGSCEQVSDAYQKALPEAKACDPLAEEQCSLLITEGLGCTCPIFVNPENAEAILRVEAAQTQYSELACAGNVACGACPEATSGVCSAEGICETRSSNSGGAACKVGGVIYESGEGGIADPFSCNTCTCVDGGLACTKIDCPEDCPPNRVNGTQCAQCGPTDACEVVEHVCLPVCNDTCEVGICLEGVCRTACG